MNHTQLDILRSSFASIEPCGAAFVSHAMQRVCQARPNIAPHWPEHIIPRASQRLFDTLRALVQHADRFHTLEEPLRVLGARSEAMGLTTADLLGAKDETLRCLRDANMHTWTWQHHHTWALLLDACVAAVVAGAAAARERTQHATAA